MSNSPDSINVYIFLHEDCRISQYYTYQLREMHAEFADAHLTFIGLFPNPTSSLEKVKAFKDKYQIPFALKTDHYHIKTKALGATITPEVVVYNETTETILYQGRIDDSYIRIGRRRQVTTTAELRDVLNAIKHTQVISTTDTQAVGCFISKERLKLCSDM